VTLFEPVDYSPPGSSGHEVFQARILEWVAISFSKRIGKKDVIQERKFNEVENKLTKRKNFFKDKNSCLKKLIKKGKFSGSIN